MCGLLFARGLKAINEGSFMSALNKQAWRGPDGRRIEQCGDDTWLGHVRLAIVHPGDEGSQPMRSASGRYSIIFNGEIYNHIRLRKEFNLSCVTQSDTETLLEGFEAYQEKFLQKINGMFSFVIYDHAKSDVWAARDVFGIKPLFLLNTKECLVYSSETVSIRSLIDCQVDQESLDEWRLIRRPMRGRTFFHEIGEVEPGEIHRNGEKVGVLRSVDTQKQAYSIETVEKVLRKSVRSHEMSDVKNVALLSGGIDSSLIASYSGVERCYSVGFSDNNEFSVANETSVQIRKDLNCVIVQPDELEKIYKKLITLKGEPLSVPNEGLIYAVCSSMEKLEKVVLTGEGADEAFFGYDRIFRWAVQQDVLDLSKFLFLYGYADEEFLTERLRHDLVMLAKNKKPIEFVEDFFLSYHLPCLLRRMDFASMAASKEARVPFVSKSVFNLMYRRPSDIKIDSHFSKKPLRSLVESLGFDHVLNTKKVGFSASLNRSDDRIEEYKKFQRLNLEVLGW